MTRDDWGVAALALLLMGIVALMVVSVPPTAWHGQPAPEATLDCRVELERVAGTLAAEMRAATVEAVSGTWEAHVEAIQTEAADEQEEWRRARWGQP